MWRRRVNLLLLCVISGFTGCGKHRSARQVLLDEPPPGSVELDPASGVPLPKRTRFDFDLKMREDYLNAYRGGYQTYAAGKDLVFCFFEYYAPQEEGWSAGARAGIRAHYKAEIARLREEAVEMEKVRKSLTRHWTEQRRSTLLHLRTP